MVAYVYTFTEDYRVTVKPYRVASTVRAGARFFTNFCARAAHAGAYSLSTIRCREILPWGPSCAQAKGGRPGAATVVTAGRGPDASVLSAVAREVDESAIEPKIKCVQKLCGLVWCGT